MKFLYHAYVGISSFRHDIYFNKLILPVATASPTTDWHRPPLIVDALIWLNDVYLTGSIINAPSLPRFAKSGTIAWHLDRIHSHRPTSTTLRLPYSQIDCMIFHGYLDDRVIFTVQNVDCTISCPPLMSA
jgi:hypothetical protein